MRIAVLDGARHARHTGYGSLARSIILGLRAVGADVRLPPVNVDWDLPEAERADFTQLQSTGWADADVALVVGTPTPVPRALRIPAVAYTQNALGDLPWDWQEVLAGYATVVVPGEFDRQVFSRYYEHVAVAPQVVEGRRFQPRPSWRAELGPEPTMTFVGSYGYRKGTDVLLDAAAVAFRRFDEPVRLRLFLGVSPNFNLTDLLRRARALPSTVELMVETKAFAPAWMARFYNQSDFVVTMSRGEGWCMPLHEALACGVPVVAPDSTAMGEFLPREGVIRVPAHEVPLSDVPDEGFRRRYETPDNVVYEVDVDVAAAALEMAVRSRADLKASAVANADAVRRANIPETMGARLLPVLQETVRRTAGGH